MAAKAVKLRPQRLVETRDDNHQGTTGETEGSCRQSDDLSEALYNGVRRAGQCFGGQGER